MNEQNKLPAKSPEDILKLLQQIKIDFDRLSKQIRILKAQQEVEDFFTSYEN